MKLCPECNTENRQNRFTCVNCGHPFYRSSKPKKERRTRDEINAEILAEREEAIENE